MVAVGGHDGRLTLADLPGRHIVRTLTGPGVPIYGVAFGPDGNIIATAFADGHVRVWRHVGRPGPPRPDHRSRPGPRRRDRSDGPAPGRLWR